MKDIFEKYGIFLEEDQVKKLLQYYEMIREWNEKINLTTIVERNEVFWKHFLDSALIMKSELWQREKEESILDIGTGAGFPGMVLAILNPKKKFVLLDSLSKRIDFLKRVIEKLQLENVKVFHGRAETYGRMVEFRNKFDFVVSRAVAELPVLMEYCIPFVKKMATLFLIRGKSRKRNCINPNTLLQN